MADPEKLLKTQQVAKAYGVSVSTIKRWVDDGKLPASRTEGKHRLIALEDAARFAREKSLPFRELELVGGETGAPAPEGPASIDDVLRDALVRALREGDAPEARRLIAAGHAAGRGAIGLADNLIRPVMERIGHGWMVGALDTYQEHQATQIVAAVLAERSGQLARSASATGSRPVALGASPEGDPYTLPVLAGELVLRELGWDVRNLGDNLPLRSLANAVREYRPRLVFLSVSHLEDPARFLQEYSHFYEAASRTDAAIMLGGRALGPELRAQLICASFGERMVHLAEFARRLHSANRSASADGSRERSDKVWP